MMAFVAIPLSCQNCSGENRLNRTRHTESSLDGVKKTAKCKLEYLWLDGYKPVPNIRGKTQTSSRGLRPAKPLCSASLLRS